MGGVTCLSGSFILVFNIIVTITIVIALAVPWWNWKYTYANSDSFGESVFDCSISHSISWFNEYCSTSFFCDSDSTFNGPSCNLVQSYWRSNSSQQRIEIYDVSFSLCIAALILNVIGFCFAIYRLRDRDHNKNKWKGIFSILPLFFIVAAVVYFPLTLPAAYNSESVDGLCTVKYGPNLYMNNSNTNLVDNPCQQFSGQIVFDNGSTFSWGGSGLYALIPAAIFSFFHAVLIIITIVTNKHYHRHNSHQQNINYDYRSPLIQSHQNHNNAINNSPIYPNSPYPNQNVNANINNISYQQPPPLTPQVNVNVVPTAPPMYSELPPPPPYY